MTVEEIRKMIKDSDYEYYGVRGDAHGYKAGERHAESHNWFQDEVDDENGEPVYPWDDEMKLWDGGELNGTCAWRITEDSTDEEIKEAIAAAEGYAESIYLIAGDAEEDGYEYGEVIIINAKVIGII